MKNYTPPLLTGALLLTGTALSTPVLAHEAGHDVEEITVTGRHLEESLPLELKEYGNRVEIITAEQIKKGGYTDATQTLQALVPGLYVSPKKRRLRLCGHLSSGLPQVLYSVAGRWLCASTTASMLSTSPLDTLPAHMIERIEVLKGGQGLFYGTQSVAGVVNVITRSPSEETTGRVSLGVDTNAGTHLNALSQFRRWTSTALSCSAPMTMPKDSSPTGTNISSPAAPSASAAIDVKSMGGKYAFEYSEDLRLTVFYQHTDAALDYARPTDNFNTVNDRNEDLLSAKIDFTLNEHATFLIKAYHHDWDTEYTRIYNDKENPGQVIVKNDARLLGLPG